MIVTAHIKFSIHTTFLDGAFQAEDERLPGESIEDGVLRVRKHLENAVAILKKEQEGMRGVQENALTHEVKGGSPGIIQYQSGSENELGDYLASIQKAQSLGELKSYKLLAANEKTLYNAYNQRLKELTQ